MSDDYGEGEGTHAFESEGGDEHLDDATDDWPEHPALHLPLQLGQAPAQPPSASAIGPGAGGSQPPFPPPAAPGYAPPGVSYPLYAPQPPPAIPPYGPPPAGVSRPLYPPPPGLPGYGAPPSQPLYPPPPGYVPPPPPGYAGPMSQPLYPPPMMYAPPGYAPPGYAVPPLSGGVGKPEPLAVAVEAICALFGIYGIGWLMSKRTSVGLALLFAGLAWIVILVVGGIFTGGFGCLCLGPLHLLFIAASAITLATRES